MYRQTVITYKRLFLACISLLVLLCNLPAAAATVSDSSPKPGSYCPSKDIRLVVAEELSTSLELSMRSRSALINKDKATAISELSAARTTLHLAASRGAAARTNLLIDAIIQAWSGEDYTQLLAWFPLLQTSLLTLPNDAIVSAAEESIGRAEDIMQGDKDGDAMQSLKEARHMLACDNLDIPLQNAMQAQDELLKQLNQNAKNISYNTLRDALRSALLYTLQNSEK
jgi:hypothetical protein